MHDVDPTVMGVFETLLPNNGVFYDVGANWGCHVKNGLQLYDCTSESRLAHPEFTDLLACHRDRLSLLSGVATMPLQRAA